VNVAALAIRRPVATILLTIGVALAGMLAFGQLPVAPLPNIDFATIQVQANVPGASPDNMATSVASPLERHLGSIADVTEMSSQSSLGNVRITVQFGLDRDIDGAARDVQAAINAARADLPASLRQNPSYRKINPADAPIMVLSLTSTSRPLGKLYDAAANILQQRLSQLPGVGQVSVTGSALPAVRVELNPTAMFHYGIGLEDVRAALASANANSPKGQIETADFNYQIYANDQASKAEQYRDLVIAYRNHAGVKLSDVADVLDSVEDLRNAGIANGKPAIGIVIARMPGANIIEAVDAVKKELPNLVRALPGDVELGVAVDRSVTIRGSLNHTLLTLLTSVALVVFVVFVFLREWRATLVPSVAVPVSIVGAFATMYLFGFSLNNLSLMALTISTGFVVDDAIVVLENVTRHLEMGKSRMRAALDGSAEVSFTVISISLSLVAVFLPLIMMGGFLGRLFKEFTLTLTMAVLISMVVSLTATPMMCALLLKAAPPRHGRLYYAVEAAFDGMLRFYRVTLDIALGRPVVTIGALLASIGLYFVLIGQMKFSIFPTQDTGLMIGTLQGDQSISFQGMSEKLAQFEKIVQDDPAVATVVGVTGGSQVNSGFVYISLKPYAQRSVTADDVVNRLRGKLAQVAGARLFLFAVSDLRGPGGRQSNATYQYTLFSDDTSELYKWAPRLTAALMKSDVVADVNSDQLQGGLEAEVNIDRATLKRLGLSLNAVDSTLYDAYGQRQVSTIYNALNQYHVVMEVAPRFWQDPASLNGVYVSTSGASPSGSQTTNTSSASYSAAPATAAKASSTAATVAADSARNLATNSLAASGRSAASAGSAVTTSKETMIPLSAFASFSTGHTPLGVSHQGVFAAATISFNLAPHKAISDVQPAIDAAAREIGLPSSVRGTFAGTALASAQAQSSLGLLIGAAFLTVYVVLGILYESYIHPITIILTLPSAGVGALLALWLTGTDLSIIAFIGIILLIGVVKKNAIMMIDFALAAERRGLDSRAAIREACLERFRPIMMTTMAALFGALPLALGTGEGSELRHPLGITIVGGLLVSQVLTLYTTPVLFLGMDWLGKATVRTWRRLYFGERRSAFE
jgi:multidrug efflux pump